MLNVQTDTAGIKERKLVCFLGVSTAEVKAEHLLEDIKT